MSVTTKSQAGDGVVELSEAQAAKLFDEIAMEKMGMSRVEFLHRWDQGEFEKVDWDSVPGLAEVAILLPFAR